MPMQFPSAALTPSPLQTPDLLGSYVRGAMAPGELQGQQNALTQQGLGLDQLRLALRNQQAYQNVAFQQLQSQGYNVGSPSGSSGAGAQNGASSTGGIQNGPQAPAQGSGSFDGSINGFQPSTLGALALLRGDDPLKTAQGVQDYQVKQAQLKAQGPIDTFDSIFNSSTPAKTVMSNPSLIQGWMRVAPQLGFDPVRDFNDENVRAGLAFAANQVRGQAGMPPKDYPVPTRRENGAYGQQLDVDPITGKRTQVAGREMPSFTQVDVYDPKTQTTTKTPVQTGGWGMSGVGPTGQQVNVGDGAPRSVASSIATQSPLAAQSLGFNTGFKAPTDPELKSAMFASEMHSGLATLQQLERGGNGQPPVTLPPKFRTALLDAAASDNDGAIHMLLGQENLDHGLTPQQQTYVAALMPVLAAQGHAQGGARLTVSQIRQAMEAIVPIDPTNKAAMDQINKNRQGDYMGILTQAGSALHLPQYKSMLGELQQAQGTKKTLGGKGYTQIGGKWYAD